MLNKMAISKFLLGDFGEKNERGRGPSCPPIFWSLKKGTRTFNFRSNETSHDILGLLDRYDRPWGKKTKNDALLLTRLFYSASLVNANEIK